MSSNIQPPSPNQGKALQIDVDGTTYLRLPIRTHVVTAEDDMVSLVRTYACPHLESGDYLFMSERVVAITQGRAYPIADIHPSRLATFLSRRVTKSPYGIGLGSPWTMQLAINEVGLWRIFLGILAALMTKPFGIKGAFYVICGRRVAAIDGPCSYTLPPYNQYAKLGPKRPNEVAKHLSHVFGTGVVIIDANDLGVAILGRSSRTISKTFAKAVFRDNPLGQTNEQTPLCIVRQVKKSKKG